MKNKLFKLLSLGLAAVTILNTSISSFAYEVNEEGNSIDSIEYQSSDETDFSNPTNVFAKLASIYKVTIPKTVVLSGESKDASYFVKAEGDIAGYEMLHVVPDKNFNLYAKNKNAVAAGISQDKTAWKYTDFDTDAKGVIEAKDITAGKWTGKFNFNIFLDSNEDKVAGDVITDGEVNPTAKTDLRYTGNPQELLNPGKSSKKLLYSFDKKNWTSTIPTATEIGSYTVYYKPANTFEEGSPKSIDIEIKKRQIAFDVPVTAKSGLSYNGESQELISAGHSDLGTILYSTDNKTWSEDIPAKTNAGTYKVYIKVDGDEEYEDYLTSVSVNIAKNTSPITLSSTSGKITDADFLNFAITSFKDGESYTLTTSDSSVATASLSGNTVKVAAGKEGVATITVKRNATANSAAASATFTVDVGHKYVNGICTRCGEKDINSLPAGMYDSNWKMTKSWQQLVNEGTVTVNNGVLKVGNVIPGAIAENTVNSKISGYLILPDTITSLGRQCFSSLRQLQGVVLNKNLNAIESQAFQDHRQHSVFKYIYLNKENKNFKTVNGILYSADMTVLYKYPINITDGSFIVPNTVKTIETNAFNYNIYLKTVILPEGLEKISNEVFLGCFNLSNCNLPSTLTYIGSWAFASTNIIDPIFPKKLSYIGSSAYSSYKGKTMFIPSTVKTVDESTDSLNRYLGITPNSSTKIYTDATSKPSGWNNYWNCNGGNSSSRNTTIWGVSRATYNANYKGK